MPVLSATRQTSPTESSETALLRESRTLTLLLSLVTGINYGHSTLEKSFVERYQGVFERTQSNRSIALNAVATILVRNHEVIAAVAHNPTPPPLAHLAEKPAPPLDVLAMMDEDWKEEDLIEIQSTVSTGFSTVANPDDKDRHYDKKLPSPGHCVLANAGTSHWPAIRKDPWHCLKIGLKDPLTNHIATVVDYINDRKKENLDEQEKQDYFNSFGHYVVMTRWKKNFRRISHWSSQGFIATLRYLRPDHLHQAFTTTVVKFSARKDSSLCQFLANFPISEFTAHINRDVDLSRLKAISKTVADLDEGEVECDEKTFLEFHQLVFNTLLGYYKALKTFSDNMKRRAYGVPEDSQGNGYQQKKLHALPLWNFSHLLWRIAHSRILRVYMTALGHIHILRLPDESQSSMYENAIEEDVGRDQRRDTEDKGDKEEREPEAAVPEEVVPEEVAGEEAEELHRLIGIDSDPSKNALVFMRWIRLQVSHLAALNILSAFPRKAEISQNIQISLIAVNYSPPDVTSREPWKDTIRNLARCLKVTSTLDAQSAIDLIQKRIDGGDNDPSILESFRKWEHAFSGSMHCEAALASLAAYPERAIDPDYPHKGILTTLIQGWNKDSMSVSKLCCPSCWELLSILRDDTAKFNVRGRHATVYPVDLPAWLPADVLRRFVARFRDLLHAELTIMVERSKLSQSSAGNHSRNPSLQSDSGFSSTSSTSDASGTRGVPWESFSLPSQ